MPHHTNVHILYTHIVNRHHMEHTHGLSKAEWDKHIQKFDMTDIYPQLPSKDKLCSYTDKLSPHNNNNNSNKQSTPTQTDIHARFPSSYSSSCCSSSLATPFSTSSSSHNNNTHKNNNNHNNKNHPQNKSNDNHTKNNSNNDNDDNNNKHDNEASNKSSPHASFASPTPSSSLSARTKSSRGVPLDIPLPASAASSSPSSSSSPLPLPLPLPLPVSSEILKNDWRSGRGRPPAVILTEICKFKGCAQKFTCHILLYQHYHTDHQCHQCPTCIPMCYYLHKSTTRIHICIGIYGSVNVYGYQLRIICTRVHIYVHIYLYIHVYVCVYCRYVYIYT